MVTKRFIVKTRNMTGISNEVDLEFDTPLINVKSIKLKSVKLCNSFFNISFDLGNNKVAFVGVSGSGRRDDTEIQLIDGFYTLKDIEKIINENLKHDAMPGDIGDVQLKFEYYEYSNKVTIYKEVKKNSPLKQFWIKGEFLKTLGFRSSDYLSIISHPKTCEFAMKLYPFSNYYIHCDLIDKRTNYFNSKQSEILCMLPVDRTKRWWDMVSYSSLDYTFKPNKNDINSMKLWITDEKNNQVDFNGYPIFYEFEVIEDDTKDIKNVTIQESNFSCNINEEHFEDDPETVSIEPNSESISCCQ